MGHYPLGVKTWPKGTVPYEIDHGISWNQQALDNLILAIKKVNTALSGSIVLRERKETDRNWIRFTWSLNPTFCASPVGMQGGEQIIRCSLKSLIGKYACEDGKQILVTQVSTGTFMHEIGHALGLNHEHQRHDRDAYVILEQTIAKKIAGVRKVDFDKISPNSAVKHGVYDCKSIMHYPELAVDGVPYFYAKPGSPCHSGGMGFSVGDLGQRTNFTAGDIAALKALY